MNAMGRHSLASVLATVITVAWHLARILLAVGVVLLVVAPFVDPPRIEIQFAAPVAFTLSPNEYRVTSPTMDAKNVRLGDAEGSLYFSPRSPGVVIAGAIAMVAFAALSVWMLGNLKGVFASLRARRPFVPANATRIRRVGGGLLALEVVRAVMAYASSYGVMTRFAAEGLRFHSRVDFDLIAIIAALILFVIAEVFREGTRLDEEQSLTV